MKELTRQRASFLQTAPRVSIHNVRFDRSPPPYSGSNKRRKPATLGDAQSELLLVAGKQMKKIRRVNKFEPSEKDNEFKNLAGDVRETRRSSMKRVKVDEGGDTELEDEDAEGEDEFDEDIVQPKKRKYSMNDYNQIDEITLDDAEKPSTSNSRKNNLGQNPSMMDLLAQVSMAKKSELEHESHAGPSNYNYNQYDAMSEDGEEERTDQEDQSEESEDEYVDSKGKSQMMNNGLSQSTSRGAGVYVDPTDNRTNSVNTSPIQRKKRTVEAKDAKKPRIPYIKVSGIVSCFCPFTDCLL